MTDGYDVDLPIKGFSQIHTNGAGGPGHYGNFLFSPQIQVTYPLSSPTVFLYLYPFKINQYCFIDPKAHQ
jgi:hypothetical protein